MLEPGGLTRTLLGISELELRVRWLDEQLRATPAVSAARVLNQLCEANERAESRAREAYLPLALLLVRLGSCELVDELHRQSTSQALWSLERMLRRDASDAVSEPGEARVPDYGRGRELTLGERRSLARRPDRRAFERLLNDPHPLVIRQLLENPKLTENDLVRLCSQRPARRDALLELASSARWLCRPRVRMTLIYNPGAPSFMTIPLLGTCTRPDLRAIVESAHSPLLLRATAREIFERLPPLSHEDPTLLQ